MSKPPTSKRQAILDMIAKGESKGNYNVLVGGKEADLTGMTIGEVKGLQEEMKKRVESGEFLSSAVGKFQIINKTLNWLQEKTGDEFPDDRLFDEETQDAMGNWLLDNRGYKDFEAGKISDEQMALNLSKEWASLPNPKTGKSYYDGDGRNNSSHKVEEVFKVLNTMETTRGRLELPDAPVAREGSMPAGEIQGDSSRPPMRQDALRSSYTNTEGS
jgi:muramidase (phage lysozyme)